MRRAYNSIDNLEDENGDLKSEPTKLKNIVTNYFRNLFSSSGQSNMEEVIACIEPRVSEAMNAHLCAPYTRGKVEQALHQMHPHKAPGPDGMNAFFFQRFWHIVGDDVTAAVLAILEGHPIPLGLNHTFVSLIPKKPKLTVMGDFRPISLCNVVYKLLTKVITNHLKVILNSIVSDSQSAFTLGRLITDNILTAFEIFHAMNIDTSVKGHMAIKLDMIRLTIVWNGPFSQGP